MKSDKLHQYEGEKTFYSESENSSTTSSPLQYSTNNHCAQEMNEQLEKQGIEMDCLREKLKRTYKMIDQLKADQKTTDALIDTLKNQLQFYKLQNSSAKHISQSHGKKSLEAVKKTANIIPVLNAHIFPHVKFFRKEDLDNFEPGQLPLQIMKLLNVPENNMASFWSDNRNTVKKLFEQYRSGAQQQMKTALFDARIAVQMEKTDDNTKTFINEIFEDNFDVDKFHRDKETYVSFLTYVGKHVVKLKHFKALVSTQNTSARDVNEWFTPQDEALAIVLFENGIERWKCEFNLRLSNAEENPAAVTRTTLTKEQKLNIPQHRYTDRSKRKNNLMKGWDVTGMIRYSELVKIVQTFRLTDAYVHFSKHAVDLLQNRKLQRSLKRKSQNHCAEMEAENARKLRTLFADDSMKINFPDNNELMQTTFTPTSKDDQVAQLIDGSSNYLSTPPQRTQQFAQITPTRKSQDRSALATNDWSNGIHRDTQNLGYEQL